MTDTASGPIVLNHARVALGDTLPECGGYGDGYPCHYELAPAPAGNDFELDVWWWGPATSTAT